MARWLVTEAREEKAEEEEENHSHQMPRCIPGRHGEAVPARPREVFTGGGVAAQGAPVWEASTCAAHPPKHRAANTGRISGEVSSLKATRASKTRAESSSGSPRRGGVFQIRLVGEEEDAEARNWPKVAATEDVGGGRNRRATARRFGFARERARERKEVSGAEWAGSV
jgi:hypothetical protein